MTTETVERQQPYVVPEMLGLTGLSRNALYDGVKRGEIPHLRVGRRIIFPRSAVDAWLASAGSRAEHIEAE